VLASLSRKVFAIERLGGLAVEADQRLKQLGFRNVSIKTGDGTEGWQTYAPFDSILVAAGSPSMPQPLLDQLKVGGRLVIPIGETHQSQRLARVIRNETGFEQMDFGPCTFVPLIGEHGWKDE
jgi:protein-L-isoaspartate(D-aspartate) O-methyltransferase